MVFSETPNMSEQQFDSSGGLGPGPSVSRKCVNCCNTRFNIVCLLRIRHLKQVLRVSCPLVVAEVLQLLIQDISCHLIMKFHDIWDRELVSLDTPLRGMEVHH